MDRLLPSFAAVVALALAAPAAAAPGEPPPPAPPAAAPMPAPVPAPPPGYAATPDEQRDRTNLLLEKDLNERFRRLHLERREEALPAFGFGLLAAGGAYWIASETDARGTWAVIVGHLAAGALTDAVILGATPDPGRRCLRDFDAMPGDTPEALARRVALGERCLEAAAQREASLRLTRGFRDLAVGASTVALWGTEAKQNRDRTLLWIAGVDGVFALFHLIPGDAERSLAAYREQATDLRLAPAPTVDAAGRMAPGFALRVDL